MGSVGSTRIHRETARGSVRKVKHKCKGIYNSSGFFNIQLLARQVWSRAPDSAPRRKTIDADAQLLLVAHTSRCFYLLIPIPDARFVKRLKHLFPSHSPLRSLPLWSTEYRPLGWGGGRFCAPLPIESYLLVLSPQLRFSPYFGIF